MTYDGENKYATFDNEDCDEDSKIYLLTILKHSNTFKFVKKIVILDYYPMPRPIPVSQVRPGRRVLNAIRTKRSIMYRPPYGSQTIHDPTKAFRESNVIYLSDLKIYRECQSNSMNYVYYGKLID